MMQSAGRLIRMGQALRESVTPIVRRSDPQCHRGQLERFLAVRTSSTSTSAPRFAAVDHSHAYESQVNADARHGRQLALAQLAGEGKDDPVFDPFLEDELREDAERNGTAIQESEASLDGENNEEMDEEEDEEEEDDDGSVLDGLYNRDGSLRWSKAERAVLRAGSPAGGLFAVLELAGSQFKVTTDDVLIVNRLPPPFHRVGTTHEIESVLLAGSTHMTLVGMPTVAGAHVKVMVEEITKDEKVIVFRKRRRKNWKKKNGFRRDITMLRILDIALPPPYDKHPHVERVAPKALLSDEPS
jgi:large subunit ribosomal protein L21